MNIKLSDLANINQFRILR